MKTTPEQATENWRRNIRRLCADRGAQTRLAERAGIGRHYLATLLAGTKTPSLTLAYRIADAAGCDLSTLALPEKKFSRAIAIVSR